jgi:hypothetical protein
MSAWAIGRISVSKRIIMNYFGFGISKSIYEDQREVDYDIAYNYQLAPRPLRSLDVYNFKITQWHQCGIYLIVKINYPSAKHYEGNKVLVYEGIEIEDLLGLKAIDPHFSETKQTPTPIARFEPNDQGWVNAMKFCSMLHSERLELEY